MLDGFIHTLDDIDMRCAKGAAPFYKEHHMGFLKRNLITVLLCLFAASVSIKPAHCGIFGQWMSDQVQSMANEMIEGLGSILSTGGYEAGDALVTGMVQGFGPDLDAFLLVVSGGTLKSYKTGSNYHSTNHSMLDGMNAVKRFQNAAAVFGFAIAIFIFIFSLFLYFFAEPGSIKDTPFRLVIRFAIAMFLIWNAASVMDIFMDSANKIWTDYIMTSDVSGEDKAVSFDDVLVGEATDNTSNETVGNSHSNPNHGSAKTTAGALVGTTILGVVLGGSWVTMAPLAAFVLVLIIILSWPMLKGFFKLYIEIVERYLVCLILYFFFGAAAGTVVSKNSSRIMWSYLQMFGCQVFILFANVAFMSVFVETLCRGGFTCSIPNYVMGLAYLRICQKLDSYMAMLGLNVAQTGGQTMDCIAGVARGMIGAARTAGRGVQSSAKVGSAQALGAGNYKMAAGLNMIGGGIPGVAQVATNGGIRNGGLTKAGLDMAAKAGQKVNVDKATATKTVSDYLSNTANQTYRGRVNALSADSLKEGLQSVLNSGGQNIDISNVDTSDMMRGTVGFTGTTADGRKVSGKLSSKDEPGNIDIMGGDGKHLSYMSMDNTLTNSPGKIVRGDASSLGYASGMSVPLSNADKSFTSKISGMSYNPGNKSFNLYDAKDRQIGTITNTNGSHMVVPSMDSAKSTAKSVMDNADARAKIEQANGFKPGSLEWNTSFNNGTGKLTGTAELMDEYESGKPKRVDVAGFDVGCNSDKLGIKDGTTTTLDDDMHQILVVKRLQKGLDTEGSKGD